MINRVERDLLDEIQEIMHLDDKSTSRSERVQNAFYEIVQILNVWKGIGCGNQRGFSPGRSNLMRARCCEKPNVPITSGEFREVFRRINPEGPNAVSRETLQQSAIIATNINDEIVLAEPITADQIVAQLPKMIFQSIRSR